MDPQGPATSSAISCAICLENRSSDIARAVPCGHEFDTDCISTLLKSSGLIGRHCPLCRSHIQEIHYNFLPDGSHKTHVAGPTRPESPLMSGPFIREDEELRAEMSPAERSRVLEFRRLRQGELYNLKICLHKRQAYGQQGGQNLTMRRYIELAISQDPYDACTKSTITRTVNIRHVPIISDHESESHQMEVSDDTEAIARARWKARLKMAEIGVHHQEFTKLSMTGLEYKVLYDTKGLAASVKKTTIITKDDGLTGHFTLLSTLDLNEVFKAQPPATDPDQVNGIDKTARELAIRLAREEIQGVLEFVFVQDSGYKALEGGSTGIVEVNSGVKCEYCVFGGHRNGDCELSGICNIDVVDGSR